MAGLQMWPSGQERRPHLVESTKTRDERLDYTFKALPESEKT